MAQVQLQAQPSINDVQPLAIDRLVTTRVTITGDSFAPPLRVLTTAPIKTSVVEVSAKKAVIDLTPEQELPLGPVGIWLATPDGSSTPLSLLVDSLPSTPEANDNHSVVSAQSLGVSSAIDGSTDGKTFDYFRIHADQGQSITFEVLTQVIGSAGDPVVRLLHEDGRVLRTVDDEANSPDCRFRHQFETAGNYVLEIHENRYRAGHRYRLRAGNLPMIAFPYPPVVQRGTCAQLAWAGTDAERISGISLNVPDHPYHFGMNVTATDKTSGAATWSHIEFSDSIQMIESEPNDSRSEANSIGEARGVNGLLQKPRDLDCFKFNAAKDQTLRFSARTRSLGSASLLKMSVRNQAGDVIGKSSVTDADESSLDVKFNVDGEYCLEVQDLLQRGGPEHGYHVAITAPTQVQLSLKADASSRDRWNLQQHGGAGVLNLVVDRAGYDAPIDLHFDPPMAGLKLLNPQIAAGAKAASIAFVSTAEFDHQQISRVCLVGVPTGNPNSGLPRALIVRSTALLVQRAPHVPYPPSWQESGIVLAGIADQPPLFTWAEAEPKEPRESAKTESDKAQVATIQIAMVRSLADGKATLHLKRLNKEFKGAVTLVDRQLPEKWSVSEKLDKDVMTLSLKHPVAETANDNTHRLQLWFFGELGGSGQLVQTELQIELFDPLDIKSIEAQSLEPGKSKTFTVDFTRHAKADQPVAVKLVNLPKGISVQPEVIMVAGGDTKAEITLVAAADAPAIKAENLSLAATTKVGEQEVTLQSPAFSLTVGP